MKITYDEKTEKFETKFGRMIVRSKDGVKHVSNTNDANLHEFFLVLSHILEDDDGKIVLGRHFCTITRKKLTGEVLGCTVPYTVCLAFSTNPYLFIDQYL